MPPGDLTPTSYLVIGILATCGPATPYGIKQLVQGSVGYFWSFPHSQIYAQAERLAAAGLLSEERETGGRNRRVYSVTEAGEAALRAWLAEPVNEQTEVRDLGLLKFFFGELATDTAALARAQVENHSHRLAEYEAIAERLAPFGNTYGAAAVRMGVLFERTVIAFWTSVAEDPPVGGIAPPGR